MSRHNFIIPENLDGLRVDKALTLYCGDTGIGAMANIEDIVKRI